MYLLRKANLKDKVWLNTCTLGVSNDPIHQTDDYFIVENVADGQRVGMLAIEFYEGLAYLHSLRLAKGVPSVRQLGVLLDYLIAYCKKQGKKQLCLVVPPTSHWMTELGFSQLLQVPTELLQSTHYQQVAKKGLLLAYPLIA